eukprot:182705-Chlamydomonas_euryale.AAC.17
MATILFGIYLPETPATHTYTSADTHTELPDGEGTRLILKEVSTRVLKCDIGSDSHAGHIVPLPRWAHCPLATLRALSSCHAFASI